MIFYNKIINGTSKNIDLLNITVEIEPNKNNTLINHLTNEHTALSASELALTDIHLDIQKALLQECKKTNNPFITKNLAILTGKYWQISDHFSVKIDFFNYVLFELLKNSSRAINEHPSTRGTIEILFRASKTNSFNLSISDNGIGFAQTEPTLLFSKGFTTKKQNNKFFDEYGYIDDVLYSVPSGLGLYYSRKFIQNILHGSINLGKNTPNGAKVAITVPFFE